MDVDKPFPSDDNASFQPLQQQVFPLGIKFADDPCPFPYVKGGLPLHTILSFLALLLPLVPKKNWAVFAQGTPLFDLELFFPL